MSGPATTYRAAALFDGETLHHNAGLTLRDGQVVSIDPSPPATAIDLGEGTLAPGFVDLQVNGGGGVMFNDAPTPETLQTMIAAHARLGTTALLPTLITDTPEHTSAAIKAAIAAIEAGLPGIAGLHLEGPHLSVARKGAHDPALIRPMEDSDLARLLDAAARLPTLKVTVAPETVTPDQISTMANAGIIVSLGHSDADYATCAAAARAGAACVTHLFNAMSQLGNREPGLVGAALDLGDLHAGIIADGIHVHLAAIRSALRAKQGPGAIFLVTDAMAPAGSDIASFTLNGRRIVRRDGRLTLADGTLAGADLDFATALQVLTRQAGLPLHAALAMATSTPARVIGRSAELGHLAPGRAADFVMLSPDLALQGVWQRGVQIA